MQLAHGPSHHWPSYNGKHNYHDKIMPCKCMDNYNNMWFNECDSYKIYNYSMHLAILKYLLLKDIVATTWKVTDQIASDR